MREASVGDAAAVALLVTAMGYPTTQPEAAARLERIIGDRSYRTIVAERDGRVVGFAGARTGPAYELDASAVQLAALAVDPAERRSGVGRLLVAAVEDWAREQGAQVVVLHSGFQRVGAHAFYRRLGYRDTGLRFRKELTGGPQ